MNNLINHVLQVIGTEWLWIIFLAIFLLFGSNKLPELSRAIGKAMAELQKGRQEIEREFRLATATPRPLPKNHKTNFRPISRFAKAAEEMGIDSKGKSDEDLRQEIIDFLKEKSDKNESGKNTSEK